MIFKIYFSLEVVMLEDYFVRPDTIDRIRASWISEPIEEYVRWLKENGYSPKMVPRRVPLLIRFGAFALARGASKYSDLPDYVGLFINSWIRDHRKIVKQSMRFQKSKGTCEIRSSRCFVASCPDTQEGGVLTNRYLLAIRCRISFHSCSKSGD